MEESKLNIVNTVPPQAREKGFLTINEKEVVVVMFSGGLESTAALQHAVNEGYYPIAVQTVYSNITNRMQDICIKIATAIGADYKVMAHQEDPFSTMRGLTYWDGNVWATDACAVTYLLPNLKAIWYGANSGLRVNGDGFSDPNWVEKVYYPPMAVEAFARLNKSSVTMYPPLGNLTKLQQWDMLSDEVRQLVVSCSVNPEKPCGKCRKCVELISLTDDNMFSMYQDNFIPGHKWKYPEEDLEDESDL